MEDLISLTGTEIGKQIINKMAETAKVSDSQMNYWIVTKQEIQNFFIETFNKVIVELKN